VTLSFRARCARLGSIPTTSGSLSGSGRDSPGPTRRKRGDPLPYADCYTGTIASNRSLGRITSACTIDWSRMDVHLIDGTYELFRHFFAVPSTADVNSQEVGAVRGVLASVLSMIENGATHLGVATDHVVESFRNDLYPEYKTSEGVPAELLSQFPILEEALNAMGVVVWPMVCYEADDALSSAAAKAALDDRVSQVLICTPDKDLSQCVVGTRVVQLDRRRNVLRDEAGVVAKFGVKPQSIPDYLAVVGDSADGYPGLAGWGAKAAALTLSQYTHLEDIPKDWHDWHPSIRRARPLSESLFNAWNEALLFRTLATLRLDVPVFDTVDALRWKGACPDFLEHCRRMLAPDLFRRAVAAESNRV
jgi:5'-3' exonuclease